MKIKVGNIPITLFTEKEVNNRITNAIKKQDCLFVLNSNANLIFLANTSEKWLIELFNSRSTEVFCDGKSVILMSKLFRFNVPDKITYNNWIYSLGSLLEKNNNSIYLLGANQAVSVKSKSVLKKLYPRLRVDSHHGYFNKAENSAENIDIINKINDFVPNVLLVCFGMPIQEKWILENKKKLHVNVYLTGGAALDYVTGNFKMTPKLWDKLYLEWFYRLLQDPKRLLKRYTIGNLGFVYYSFKAFFKKRND